MSISTYKSFTTEDIEKYVNEFLQKNEEKETILLPIYMDRIRNCRELREEMLLEI